MPSQDVKLPEGVVADWLHPYVSDFRHRMLTLLGFEFRKLSCRLAYQLAQASSHSADDSNGKSQVLQITAASTPVSRSLIAPLISQFDLRRLEAYSRNMVDFHLIMDLVPTIARLFFGTVLPPGTFNLSPV